MSNTIDLRPTWGEVGLLIKRLADSGESAALKEIWPEAARAFAAAEALNSLVEGLSEEQKSKVAKVLAAELTKQGY